MENVDIYFFSGTGNTLLVVKKITEIFRKNNINVKLNKIEESNPEEINLKNTIGLGFPVAELSTYQFVWDFIKRMPYAEGTEVFMIDTLAGFSGGIVGPLRKILEKKGYKAIGAKEIIMPPNIFYIQDHMTNKKKIENGLDEAREYANSLIEGTSYWGRVPILSDALYYSSIVGLKLTHTDINQKYLKLKVNTEKCNKCGLCEELCPVQNIEINEGCWPINLMKCQYCLRCTSFCPKNAISCPVNYKGKTYRSVKAKEFVEL
jgi:NAD-dependent dihydropyrimidine dehydrogenase PreA subunit